MPAIEFSVIVPAYNEGKIIASHIEKLHRKLEDIRVSYEIIIVNDGSRDDTLNQAMGMARDRIKVFSYMPNKGKGYAVRYGMGRAQGTYRLFMDADLATDLNEVENFLKIIRRGDCDILIGNRKSFPLLVSQPFYRRFFGHGFTWISSMVTGCPMSDFTCGFKMFSARAVDIVFRRQMINDWAFDTELIYVASLHGLRIQEAPVVWKHQGNSKVRVLKDVFVSLAGLIQMRINAAQGLYR